ncbi:MAG: DUF4157 domain-containing protein [Okeania sp. SIO2C9]|nr:DUF4157 domain-containing protein [Okeania sp. SIO2C9]
MSIQPKLTVGEPNDAYEQEADRVARRVVDEINAPASVQRHTGDEEIQMKPHSSAIQLERMTGVRDFGFSPKVSMVQREGMEEGVLFRRAVVNRMDGYAGGDATGELETAIEGARGSGQHLDPGWQAKMGQAMGADFSGVRVHTDSQSDRLNQSIQAKAFTTGQDVFFRQGAYEPGIRGGQELIAHELTHVVQQNGGVVQRQSDLEEEEPLQGKFATDVMPTQLQTTGAPVENRTGIPDSLKVGLEQLSGLDMSGVRVHYNSAKPAQLNALAYTQGQNIEVGPGQERHLPHEGWHVVQQMQGRVKPTMQTKGMSINDDAALECEADVFGQKAAGDRFVARSPAERRDGTNKSGSQIQSTHATEVSPQPHASGVGGGHRSVIQRLIEIGEESLSAAQIKPRLQSPLRLERRNEAGKIPKIDLFNAGILDGVLPVYDKQNRQFNDWIEFAQAMSVIVEPYWLLWNVGSNAAEIVNNQKKVQALIVNNRPAFSSLVTTLGFEHEFAQMKNGPLRGVSHLELTRSKETLPLTNLPWILETDAESTLELVSPPFAVPTVGGRPMPHADVVNKMDNILKTGLVGAVKGITGWMNWGKLPELVSSLNTALGIEFQSLQELSIGPENLSAKTQLDELPGPAITAGRLGEIEVGASNKHSGGMDSQINFAADIETLDMIQDLGKGLADKSTQILKRIERKLAEAMPVPKDASGELAKFYPLLHRKLAGLFAIQSQAKVRDWQKQAYSYLAAKQTEETVVQPPTPQDFDFDMDALLSSVVKDVSPLWVKDHLVSLAKGMLTEDDLAVLADDLKKHLNLSLDVGVRKSKTVGIAEGFEKLLEERLDQFNADLKQAIKVLYSSLSERDFTKADERAASGFLEHDPQFIGARQDTYLNPSHVQQEGLWSGRRLHVAEIRKGNVGILSEGNRRATEG